MHFRDARDERRSQAVSLFAASSSGYVATRFAFSDIVDG